MNQVQIIQLFQSAQMKIGFMLVELIFSKKIKSGDPASVDIQQKNVNVSKYLVLLKLMFFVLKV